MLFARLNFFYSRASTEVVVEFVHAGLTIYCRSQHCRCTAVLMLLCFYVFAFLCFYVEICGWLFLFCGRFGYSLGSSAQGDDGVADQDGHADARSGPRFKTEGARPRGGSRDEGESKRGGAHKQLELPFCWHQIDSATVYHNPLFSL